MIFCKNCGKQLEDNALFCPDCGAATEKPAQEAVMTEEAAPAVSPAAAAIQADEPATPAPEAAYYAPAQPEAPAKKSPKLALIIGGIAAAVVALIVIIVLAVSLFGPKEAPMNDRLFYFKDDGNLYMSTVNKKTPAQVSKEFFDFDLDNSDIAYADLAFEPLLLSDGKTLIYPDKINEYGNEYTLYVRNVQSLKKDPVKIGDSISSVKIPESEKFILYKEDGNLYKHDFSEKQKIASDVTSYTMSGDGKVIYFIDDDSKLYIKSGNKEKVKIASDVDSICYVNSKYDTVYFSEKGDEGRYIYYSKNGKEKVKFASDVMSLKAMYDSGEAYYTKYDKNDGDVLYYNDGKEEIKLVEQVDSVTRYSDSAKIVISAYEDDDEEDMIYYFASKENLTKLDAENATKISFSDDGKTLYYLNDYDNDDYTGDLTKVSVSGNTPKNYEVLDGDVNTYTLIESTCIYKKDKDDGVFTLCIDGKEIAKEVCDLVDYYNDHKVLLYFTEPDEDDETATLNIYNGKKSKVVDTDVCDNYVTYNVETKAVYYFIDYDEKDDEGTLKCYKNGKASVIAHDVYHYSILDGKKLVYETEYDDENYTTTLMYYDGRKSKTLCEDVENYNIVEGDKIYILGEYSGSKDKGTLYLAKNGKADKIDEDVVSFCYYDNYKLEKYWMEEYSEYYPEYYTNYFSDSKYDYEALSESDSEVAADYDRYYDDEDYYYYY